MLKTRKESPSKKNHVKNGWTKIKKGWHFIWNDDSPLSWLLAIVTAFVIVRFLVYPLLGLVLGTGFPIVAIVSGSMEHAFQPVGSPTPEMCGVPGERGRVSFEVFWETCGNWYVEQGISKELFESFPFRRGMYKGDVIVLASPRPENIQIGDVIVFIQEQNPVLEPIIHRVVGKNEINGTITFKTKGDHNRDSFVVDTPFKYLNEHEVREDQVVGRAIIRIPWIGYIRVWAYDLLLLVRGIIQ